MNLSLDAYGMFGKVGISAPLIVGEVPRCVELLNEKKEEFLEKRKVKKERIAAGLEDPVVGEESKDEEKKEKNGKKNKNKKKGGGDGGGGKMLVTVSFEVKEDEKTVVVSISPKKED